MLVSDVLLLVRYAVGDMNDSNSSYYQKMVAINAANRFIRKIIFQYKSSLLNYTETQNTVAATTEYTLTHKPNRIIYVRVDGVKVDPANQADIYDLTQSGKPQRYYMSAFDKISFWPVPDAVYPFSVYMVEGSSDLTDSDTILWTADFADVMVEYAAGLLAGSLNAYSLKPEIIQHLCSFEPRPAIDVDLWACTKAGCT